MRREGVRVGTALAARDDAASKPPQRTRAAAAPVDPAPGLLVVAADGATSLFAAGWHAVTRGMVAGWEAERLVGPSCVAARESVGTVGPRRATEAARRGALTLDRWAGGVTGRGRASLRPALVLGAGAPWLGGLAAEDSDQRGEVVACWHAGQHRHRAAAARFGETAEATTGAAVRQADLATVGPAPGLAAFARAKPPSPPRPPRFAASNAIPSPSASTRWRIPPCASTAAPAALAPSRPLPILSSSVG